MSFWDFIVMLGSPAKPWNIGSWIDRIVQAIVDPDCKESSMMDTLRAAERNMRND